MKLLDNEEILWGSDSKGFLLTTHRLRTIYNTYLGSSIKSIMLEELTACELRTIRQFHFLRKALWYFLLINGAVYLMNHYLFKSELIKIFFGQVHVGPDTAQLIFYLSLAISVTFILLFFLSAKKVYSFYAIGVTIDIHLRGLDFEERESFISQVEAAKDKRYLHSR